MVGVMVVRHAPSRYLKAALCNYHLCFLSFRNPLYQSAALALAASVVDAGVSRAGGLVREAAAAPLPADLGGLPRPEVEAGGSGEIPI